VINNSRIAIDGLLLAVLLAFALWAVLALIVVAILTALG
jgi:hypothetical protein